MFCICNFYNSIVFIIITAMNYTASPFKCFF